MGPRESGHSASPPPPPWPVREANYSQLVRAVNILPHAVRAVLARAAPSALLPEELAPHTAVGFLSRVLL